MDKVVNNVILMVATTTILTLAADTSSSCSFKVSDSLEPNSTQCTVDITCIDALDSNANEEIQKLSCVKNKGNKYEANFQAKNIISGSSFMSLNGNLAKSILKASIIDSKNITEIPDEIYLLEKANTIEIKGCSITKVNVQKLSTLSDIQEIILSNDLMSHLEEETNFRGKDKTKLKHIDLSNNMIITIPNAYFQYFKSLISLDFSYNIISNIDILSFQGLDQLKKLYLSHNNLSGVGFAFYRFQNLEILSLDHNKIKDLTENSFKVMLLLKKLDLSHNNLHKIDENIFNHLYNLEELDLSDNLITSISPQTFKTNLHLKELILKNNNITNMGQESFAYNIISNFQIAGNLLKTCSKLSKGLKITNYDLSAQRLQTFEANCVAGLDVSKLKELYLNKNSITDIKKDSLVNMINLEILDLSENNITQIQFTTADLTSLKTFNVHHNKIKDINKEIFINITRLENLDLSYNEISVLDKTIFEDLRELKIIKLNNNPIRNAIETNEFKNCGKVTELDLSHTEIDNFNENAFSGMKKLQVLKASYCNISSVHIKSFDDTGSIKSLDLSHNSLIKFLVDTKDFTNLINLNLNHNLIKNLEYDSLNFIKLKSLNLSYNGIKLIEPQHFASFHGSIKHIDLSFNEQLVIMANTFREFQLNELILKGIKSITFTDAQNTAIDTLDVSSCKISNISHLSLNKVIDIKVLILSDNNIDSFNKDSLKELSVLKSVDLSENLIKKLPEKSFENNLLVEKIKLNKNNIEDIANKAFYGLQKLQTLELSNNHLPKFDVSRLPSLLNNEISLSLDNNFIHQISFEDFERTVKVLNIDNNPISCDEIQRAKKKVTFIIEPKNTEKFCQKPTTSTPKVVPLSTEVVSMKTTPKQAFIDPKNNLQNKELKDFIATENNKTLTLIVKESNKSLVYEQIKDTIQKEHNKTSELFLNKFDRLKVEKSDDSRNNSKASNNNSNALLWVAAVCSVAIFIIIIAKLSHSLTKSRNQK